MQRFQDRSGGKGWKSFWLTAPVVQSRGWNTDEVHVNHSHTGLTSGARHRQMTPIERGLRGRGLDIGQTKLLAIVVRLMRLKLTRIVYSVDFDGVFELGNLWNSLEKLIFHKNVKKLNSRIFFLTSIILIQLYKLNVYWIH